MNINHDSFITHKKQYILMKPPRAYRSQKAMKMVVVAS